MNIVKSHETRQVKMTLDTDGILRYSYRRPGTIETLEDAQKNIDAFLKFMKWRKEPRYHAIVDLTNLRRVAHGVRKLYKSNEIMNLTGANAIIAPNNLAKIIGEFFIKIDKPENPTKLFTKEADAITWINTNRKQFKNAKK